jgi:hypothetical protein
MKCGAGAGIERVHAAEMSTGPSELHSPEKQKILPNCTSHGSMYTISSKLISEISFDDIVHDVGKIRYFYSLDMRYRITNQDPETFLSPEDGQLARSRGVEGLTRRNNDAYIYSRGIGVSSST